MPDIRHKRGTMAAFLALAGSEQLLPGQIYVITDRKQLALALTSSAYELFQSIAVSATPPDAPYEGQLWLDIST